MIQTNKNRCEINSCHYHHDLVYATEIENTHALRVCCALKDSSNQGSTEEEDYNFICANDGPSHSLIYSRANLADSISFEYMKYVSRIFYIPNCCYDPISILHHDSFITAVQTSTSISIFKFQTSPKQLEESLIALLTGNSNMNAQFSNYTHIFQCVYSKHESLYRWGIIDLKTYNTNSLNFESLQQMIIDERAIKYNNSAPPICRAFHKIQEIVEHYLPTWNWSFPSNCDCEGSLQSIISSTNANTNTNSPRAPDVISVDVGASPGGWTQFLSMKSSQVIAIDPGKLADIIAKTLPNVTHIADLAQSQLTSDALATAQRCAYCNGSCLRLAVCDMNIRPSECAEILRDCILPHMPRDRG